VPPSALLVDTLLRLLGQGGGGATPDPASLVGWLQTAATAVMVVLFVMGWVVPKPVLDQALQREAKQNERLDNLQKQLNDALVTTGEAMKVLQAEREPRSPGGRRS
jgi:hypothetical protein